MGRSISKKLTTFIIVSMFVGMFVFVLIIYLIAKNDITQVKLSETNQMVRSELEKIDRTLDLDNTILETIGLQMKYMKNNDELFSILEAQAKEHEEFISIYTGFSDDTGVFSDRWVPTSDWKATQREWYEKALQDKENPYMTEPYLDPSTGNIVMTISRYVGNFGGKEAVIAGDITINAIIDIIKSTQIEGGGYIFLVDQKGRILVHQDAQYNPVIKDQQGQIIQEPTVDEETEAFFYSVQDIPSYDKIYQQLQQGCTVEIKDYDNIQRYIVPVALNDSDWIIFGAIPRTSIEQGFNHDMMWIILAYVVILSIVGWLIGIGVKKIISVPIKNLNRIADQISVGNLEIQQLPVQNDEIGALAKSFYSVAEVIGALIKELNQMAYQHETLGDIDVTLHEEQFQGTYKEVTIAINAMVRGHIETNKKAVSCFNEIASGNFEANIELLPGKKVFINDGIHQLRNTLLDINKGVALMIENSIAGNLSYRIDVSQYQGDSKKLMMGLNQVVEETARPIQEALCVLKNMAQGNFNELMTGDYNGEFEQLKFSVNQTVTNISSYIGEISNVLDGLAQYNLNQTIEKAYVGEFSRIKSSLENIITMMNQMVFEIRSASEQVALGANQVSESSIILAQGAAKQSEAVIILNENVNSVSEKYVEGAKLREKTTQLWQKSDENATNGNQEMKTMLQSMSSIKESSDDISKIIRVIEDLAFQTNLLALNAAVEAARAGQHGKGFSVVAEEVGMLANRSQKAAGEIRALIEKSVQQVNCGTEIANGTAVSLGKIVENISEISTLIGQTVAVSKKQEEEFKQIVHEVEGVFSVVQKNSATSEENAAISEELASQSEALHNIIQKFKTKNR